MSLFLDVKSPLGIMAEALFGMNLHCADVHVTASFDWFLWGVEAELNTSLIQFQVNYDICACSKEKIQNICLHSFSALHIP